MLGHGPTQEAVPQGNPLCIFWLAPSSGRQVMYFLWAWCSFSFGRTSPLIWPQPLGGRTPGQTQHPGQDGPKETNEKWPQARPTASYCRHLTYHPSPTTLLHSSATVLLYTQMAATGSRSGTALATTQWVTSSPLALPCMLSGCCHASLLIGQVGRWPLPYAARSRRRIDVCPTRCPPPMLPAAAACCPWSGSCRSSSSCCCCAWLPLPLPC